MIHTCSFFILKKKETETINVTNFRFCEKVLDSSCTFCTNSVG